MQNELMYSFRENNVRVVMKDNEPWFYAKDVCEILELSNPTMVVSRLDEDERAKFNLGRQGETNFVSEFGLYSMILGSRKPEAREFKRWVTHDVLPSIRKNGRYEISKDSYMIDDPVKRAERWIEEQKEKQFLLKTVEIQKPKVLFAESVEDSDSTILIRDFAKILKQNGVDIGQNRLFDYLRNNGYLNKSGEYHFPSQKSMNLGIFRVIERTVNTPSGSKIRPTVKVTGKGQVYLTNKFITRD